MLVEWFVFQPPAFEAPTVPTIAAAALLALLVFGLLYARREDFTSMGQSLFILLTLAALALANVIVLRIGIQPYPLLVIVPIAAAGLWLGGAPAMIVGLAAGLSRYLLGDGLLTTPFVMALVGLVFAVLMGQRFTGRTGQALRLPIVTVPAVMVVVGWPLTLLGVLVAERSPSLFFALERAASQALPLLALMLLAGLVAGGLLQAIMALFPQTRPPIGELEAPPWRTRLRQRALYTLIPLTVLAIIALVGVVTLTSYNLATRVIVEQMSRDAANAGSGIPFVVQVGRGLIRDLADDEQLNTADDTVVQARLEDGLRAVPFFQQLLYVNPEGDLQAVYPTLESFPTDLTPDEQSRVTTALNSRVPAEVVVYSGVTGEPASLTFIAPVPGEPGGVLLGRTDLDVNPILSPVVDLLGQGVVGDGEGFVVDERGQVLIYPAQPEQQQQTFVLSEVQAVTQAGAEGQAFRQTQDDGTRRLVYVEPIAGQSNWSVVMTVPNEVTLELASQIAIPTLALLVLITGLGITLAMVTVQRITEPMEALLGSVEQIGQGTLDKAVEVRGEDEIGRLGHSFEVMRQRLKRRLTEQDQLLRVTRSVASSLELFRAMPSILSSALEVTDATSVRVVLSRDNQDEPETYASGEAASEMAALDKRLLEMVEHQGILVISQLWRASHVFDIARLPPGLKSLVAFPLRGDTRFHGILWLGYSTEHPFEEAEMTFLSTLAGQTAVAVANAQLFEDAQDRRREMEAVLASTADGIIVTDTSGRVLLINPAAAAYFGVRLDRARGRHAQEIINVPYLADALTDLNAPATELEVPGQNGKTLLVKTSSLVNEGSIEGRVAVVRDVTDLKELDNIKTVFLRMVSHDLKSPLTYMRGYVSMLPLVGDLNQRQTESLQKIEVGISNITAMTDRLTHLSRLRFGEAYQLDLGMLDVHDFIMEQMNDHEVPARQRDISLEMEVEPGLPLLLADPVLIRQAVSNLIGNAIKYTAEHGEVRVIAKKTTVDDKPMIQIDVIDNGIGIRSEDQAELFNPFYRVPHRDGDPPRPHGSGLGLALVKSIIDAHDGRVTVISEFGQGSTFRVQLPIRKPSALNDDKP